MSNPHHVRADPAGCTVVEHWFGRAVVVAVSGTVDMLSARTFQEGITSALQAGPEVLIVDLTDVEFLASRGLGVLCSARDDVPDGVRFAVVAVGPVTFRPMMLIGLTEVIATYASRSDALDALAA